MEVCKKELEAKKVHKAEVIKVDFRPVEHRKEQKKLIIFYADGEEEIREINKRPTMAELMAIVEGFPERCSVIVNGITRTLIYNKNGFSQPYKLNPKATDMRSFARINPLAQIWGTAVLIIGYRFGRI